MKKKIKIVIFVILMLIMVRSVWGICQREVLHAKTSEYELKGSGENVGLIEELDEVAQTFEEKQDFQGIAFLAGNYDRKNFGTIHLKLLDEETGKQILEKDYDAGIIKNNVMNYFLFDEPVKVDKPHRYRVVISADMKVFFSHFTIWKTKKDDYKDGALFVNGKEQKVDLVFDTVYSYEEVNTIGMKLHRSSMVILLFAFLGLHCFVDIRKMYQWIFKKRVWIALAVFVFLVANKYHFSSVAEYNAHIEEGKGSQYIETVFGVSRPIRSDEWMVSLPRWLSAQYSDYGKYNEIVRAEKTTNMCASGLYRGYSALTEPAFWGYYLFGAEFGVSFMWCFRMVFGFLFSFELCLILTKRKPLLALLGGTLIWFSSYNMWWSTVNWLLSGQAALVCFYYLLKEKTRWKKVLFGLMTAIFASNFVVNLYPAWQVPVGYVYFTILVWMIVQNWENIKSYTWKDWGIAVLCVGFMLSITMAFFRDNMEYMTGIIDTVYPGKRISYGGMKLQNLLRSIACLWTPYRNFDNPSEIGCFIVLFPIPYILGIRMLIKNIKEKKKDIFLWALMGIATIFGLYCAFPLPKLLAKILLLTYSTPYRTADVIGYIMILLLMVLLGKYGSKAQLKPLLGVGLTGIVLAGTLCYTQIEYSEFLDFKYYLLTAIVLFIVFTPLVTNFREKWSKYSMIGFTIMVLVTGLSVNPLMCGLDVIYSKPIAKKVQEIVREDSDGKWIAVDNGIAANYLIACGAPTINSVNYMPNMKLWKKLDPSGEKEKIYNRYAHISIKLVDTETTMKLKQVDVVRLYLSTNDLKKLDVKYIYSDKKLEDTASVEFEEMYENEKTRIYQVNYR
ncbi:MAG: YfhO family protein [Lachnospiraceae bacterium]|nr:YfhO family protein [Lachnospiraceae bacterium]